MTSTFRSAIFAIGFTTLGTAIGASAGAIAGPQRDARSSGQGIMKFAYAMASLDLSEDQKGMLSDLREEVRSEIRQTREEHADEGKLVADAVASGAAIDRQALHSAIDATAAARVAMTHRVLDGVLDVYDSLDAEQKRELADMVRQHQAQQEQRKETFGDSPRGRR